MAYSFSVREDPEKAVHRILVGQYALARSQLRSPKDLESTIHETRKCLKRARALLRLIEPAVGPKDFKKHDRRARDIANSLAKRRDLDVMFSTIEALKQRCQDKSESLSQALGLMEQALTARLDAHLPREADRKKLSSSEANAISAARAQLDDAIKATHRLKLSDPSPRHPIESLVRPGLVKTYKKGHRQYRAIPTSSREEDWHELRKSVQAHWRQMALLKKAWPDWFLARVELARDMSEHLGNDHDLFVLKNMLATIPQSDLPARQRKSL
ncbi:MAG: CHAD domain-containing protein, partial [Pseudomonadota bacterium]